MDNLGEVNFVDIKIEFYNYKEETEVRIIEKKEKSVIIMMRIQYAHDIQENEIKYDKKVIIYFDNMLVKDYVRLPFENSYDEDDDGVAICLFPTAKYELFF